MTPTLSLPLSTLKLVVRLSQIAPVPQSIWLIGSRANGRARPDSDTDLLVFASRAFLVSAATGVVKPIDADVLVVYDGNSFQDIWSMKNGSLASWSWKLLSTHEASYVGSKFIPDVDVFEEMPHALTNTMSSNLGKDAECNERGFKLWPT